MSGWEDSKYWRQVLAGDPCSYCGQAPAETADHIVPDARHMEAQGDWSNLTAACQPCNSKKANRSLLAMLNGHQTNTAERARFVPTEGMSVMVQQRWPQELLDRVDAIAGPRGRTKFTLAALEAALSGSNTQEDTSVVAMLQRHKAAAAIRPQRF